MKVLITTRDAENWLLAPQLHFLVKYWPDCPFPIDVLGGPKAREVFLGLVDEGRKDGLWLREAYCGDDSSWVKLLIWHLQGQNPNEPFLLLLNDYLLADRINQRRMTAYYAVMKNDPTLSFLRLNACPGPEGPSYEEFRPTIEEWGLSYFKLGQAYNLSLQPTIFRTSFLLKNLDPNWSAWDVEIKGSRLFAAGYPLNAVGTHDTALPVMNLLRRGEVDPVAKREMEEKW